MHWSLVLFGVVFVIVCVLLILIVLLQKGKGGGLGAAFGGAGSSAFGTRTGDVFTWITIVLTGLFLLLAIGTSLALRPPAGTVSPVVISPKPGPISENEIVTLTCSTKGSTIRYTTDGTDPTKSSTPYENAIEIEPGTTLKARGFRDKWESSVVTGGTYEKMTADANTITLPGVGTIPNPTEFAPAPTTLPTVPPPTTPAIPPTTVPATAPAVP